MFKPEARTYDGVGVYPGGLYLQGDLWSSHPVGAELNRLSAYVQAGFDGDQTLDLWGAYTDNGGGNHLINVASGVQVGEWCVACWQLNVAALTWAIGKNNADTAALVSTGATSVQTYTLRIRIGTSFKGHIAEAMILKGAPDFTEDQRRQMASYLRNKYLLPDVTTNPTYKTYGTYQLLDGGRADGTHHYATIFPVGFESGASRIYAVNRSTKVRTLLVANTDYYAYRAGYISVVNATSRPRI